MSDHNQESPIRCEEARLFIAAIDEEMIEDERGRRLQAHVRQCSSCQAQQQDYQRLDHMLRRRFGLASIPRRSTEAILQHIWASEFEI
jgi:hypothetical protein